MRPLSAIDMAGCCAYRRLSSATLPMDRPIPRVVCDAVVQQLHNNFRSLLNVHAIYPFLNSHRLLASLDQSRLTNPTNTTEQKIDIVLSWLPKSTEKDYLTPFVECLLNSVEEAGEAHKELAEMIEAMCEKEIRANCRSRKKLPIMKWCAIFFVTISVAVLLTVVLTVVLFETTIPKDPSEKSMRINGEATIPLNTKWLKSTTITLENCDGMAAVFDGVSCSNLPVINTTKFDKQSPPFNEYALPGSYINIKFPTNSSDALKFNIWIIETLEVWTKLSNQINKLDTNYPMRCGDKVKGATCYRAAKYLNTPIHFPITNPDYYRSIVTYSNDSTQPKSYGGIRWSYHFLTYNFSAILSAYKHTTVHFTDQSRSETITVSSPFNFKDSCSLLNFKCQKDDFYSFKISNLKHRWDIGVLILIIYMPILIILLSIIVVICVRAKRKFSNAYNYALY